jgi:hypothetical protein
MPPNIFFVRWSEWLEEKEGRVQPLIQPSTVRAAKSLAALTVTTVRAAGSPVALTVTTVRTT